tara:strand:- start:41 stop:190 length:150 start_codon:yes stop_codon:yes gene_type:complete
LPLKIKNKKNGTEDIEHTTDKGSSMYRPIKKLKKHIRKAIIDVNLTPIF